MSTRLAFIWTSLGLTLLIDLCSSIDYLVTWKKDLYLTLQDLGLGICTLACQ